MVRKSWGKSTCKGPEVGNEPAMLKSKQQPLWLEPSGCGKGHEVRPTGSCVSDHVEPLGHEVVWF